MSQSFTRDPTERELDRIDTYSNRIQHLFSISSQQRNISIGVRAALIRHWFARQRQGDNQRRRPFFPRLQSFSFSWDGQDRSTAHLAPILIGPSLLRLEVSVYCSLMGVDSQQFRILMKDLAKHSPLLHQIQITFDKDPPRDVTDSIPYLIQHTPELRSFKCRLAPGFAVAILARLPFLTEASIPLPRSLKDARPAEGYVYTLPQTSIPTHSKWRDQSCCRIPPLRLEYDALESYADNRRTKVCPIRAARMVSSSVDARLGQGDCYSETCAPVGTSDPIGPFNSHVPQDETPPTAFRSHNARHLSRIRCGSCRR